MRIHGSYKRLLREARRCYRWYTGVLRSKSSVKYPGIRSTIFSRFLFPGISPLFTERAPIFIDTKKEPQPLVGALVMQRVAAAYAAVCAVVPDRPYVASSIVGTAGA